MLLFAFCPKLILGQDSLSQSYKAIFNLPIDSAIIINGNEFIHYHSGDTVTLDLGYLNLQFIWFNKFYHTGIFTLKSDRVNLFKILNKYDGQKIREYKRKLARAYWNNAGVVITDTTTKVFWEGEYIGKGIGFFPYSTGTIKIVSENKKIRTYQINSNDPYFQKFQYFFGPAPRKSWQIYLPGTVQFFRKDYFKSIGFTLATVGSVSSMYLYNNKFVDTKMNYDEVYKLYSSADLPTEVDFHRKRLENLQSNLDTYRNIFYGSLLGLATTYILNYLDWKYNEPFKTQPKIKFDPYIDISRNSKNGNVIPQVGVSVDF
jgi:hypothetical protein